MEGFTIGLGNHWWVRAFGRNQLVRRSDRIEAVVIGLAVAVIIAAVPVAGAAGTSVHEDRTRVYAEEALTRHPVSATATEDCAIVVQGRQIVFVAEATWNDAVHFHSGMLAWPDCPKVGNSQTIWIDRDGKYVTQPSPPSRADSEAAVAAVAFWLGSAAASAALVSLVRCWLAGRRYAAWDRELGALHDNGGRTNHP